MNYKHLLNRSILYAVIIQLSVSVLRAQTIKANDIHFLTDTTSNFDTLVSKFKGNIVYVDMWATWCHPCKEELMKVKDVKAFGDFAAKNNFIILYLCCNKDNKNWRWFINANKLAGYHILVNEKLIKDLRARFSYALTGKVRLKKGFYIPRHMIIDDKGAIVDSMADRQGSASVYARLNGMLKHTAN